MRLKLEVGVDISSILNVYPYEEPIPACLSGEAIGMLPSYIPHTDQERIQNLPEIFEMHKDTLFEVSEKINGSSETIISNNGFFVCSKNINLKEKEGNAYWDIAHELKLKDKANGFEGYAIQGELYGFGIQSNDYKLSKRSLSVFNIFDILQRKYILPEDRLNMCKDLGIPHIPIIEFKKVLELGMENIIRYADGISLLNPLVHREGIVCKAMGGSISFKVLSNVHLLKQKDKE